MKRISLALAVAAAIGGVTGASAQNYPTRPITVVVAFAAGGSGDTIMRIVADHMRSTLGQTIVIENVGGAAGSIGVARVARAAPDGYMLSYGNWPTHVLNGAVYSLNYDVLKDFEPISLVSTESIAIVGKKSLPANDLKGLIGWLKANPGKASAGTTGPGGVGHVVGVFFQQQTKTQFEFVPYRGLAPAMQDMIAGQIDIMFDTAANSVPQVRAGNVKGFAVTAKARLAVAPDLPTADEAGLQASTCRIGAACGHRKARLQTSSPSSMAQSAMRWPIRPSASGSSSLGKSFCQRSSSRRRRSGPCSGRRSSGGGRSSAPPKSRQLAGILHAVPYAGDSHIVAKKAPSLAGEGSIVANRNAVVAQLCLSLAGRSALVLGDGVDQREAALLHFRDGAAQRRLHVLGLVDRAFAVAAERARERAEVGLRTEQVHADMRLGSSVPRSFAMRIWCAQSL